MKLIKQLASIVILILIFLIGYYYPNLYLYGGLFLCCLNYIHEDHKRFKDTFTLPYSHSKTPQASLPQLQEEEKATSKKAVSDEVTQQHKQVTPSTIPPKPKSEYKLIIEELTKQYWEEYNR